MQAKRYAQKIKNLVAENQLLEAITELSQLAQNSNWLNGVIMQSARYNDLNKKILLGIIPDEVAVIERNRVTNSILEIIMEIEKNSSKEFNLTINEFENRTPKEKLYDVAEIVFSVTKEIVNENQVVLTPIFKRNANIIEITERMTDLFYGQKSRGNFARWITFLKETENNIALQTEIRVESGALASVLQKFHEILYSYETDILGLKKSVIFNLSNHDINDTQSYISQYLDKIQSVVDEIGSIAEKIKLITEDDNIVSIKASAIDIYETSKEIFSHFRIINSQIEILAKSNKITKEQLQVYVEAIALIRSEIFEINELVKNDWLNNGWKLKMDIKQFVENCYQNLTIEKIDYTANKLKEYKSRLKRSIWIEKLAVTLGGILILGFLLTHSK